MVLSFSSGRGISNSYILKTNVKRQMLYTKSGDLITSDFVAIAPQSLNYDTYVLSEKKLMQ